MIDKEYEQSQKMFKTLSGLMTNKKSGNLNESVENNNQAYSIENISAMSSTINGWKNNIIENIQSSIKFNSFLFYPADKNVIINFTIVDVNINVKMKLNDSTTYGLFIWANELQLNDVIMQKIQHIKAAFDNWRSSLIKDSSILNDIENFINRQK